MPEALESDAVFLERMEAIRCAASVAMGLAPDIAKAAQIPSVPKVAMVTAPRHMTALSRLTLFLLKRAWNAPDLAQELENWTCLIARHGGTDV